MDSRMKGLRHSIGSVVKTYPIEIVISFIYLVMELWNSADDIEYQHSMLFPLAFLLSLTVHNLAGRKMPWVYYATVVPPIAMFFVDITTFFFAPQFWFLFPLIMVAYLFSRGKTDNKAFAVDTINVCCYAAIAGALAMISMIALSIMLVLLDALFGVHYTFIIPFNFSAYLVMPVTFLIAQASDDTTPDSRSKVADIAVNFIICPAIIAYAAIFYLYGINIVAKWELPDGGLAAMVLIYFIGTIFGKMLLANDTRCWYGWFFNNFHIISLPLMVLYWAGLSYRIGQYSFTMSRVYLAVAGVAMLCIIAMMFVERWNKYRLMLICASAFIVAFTYIPGLSADDIGYRAQLKRFYAVAEQIQVLENGKLNADALTKIKGSDEYDDLLSIYLYLRSDIGKDAADDTFGKWIQDDEIWLADQKYQSKTQSSKSAGSEDGQDDLEYPIDYNVDFVEVPLGDYRSVLINRSVDLDKSGAVKVYDAVSTLILSDTIHFDRLQQLTNERHPLDVQEMTLSNDSVCVVFYRIHIYRNFVGFDATVLKK